MPEPSDKYIRKVGYKNHGRRKVKTEQNGGDILAQVAQLLLKAR